MKETPIILGTTMVKATLEDRKTNTRRLRGLDRFNESPDSWIATPTMDPLVWAFVNEKLPPLDRIQRVKCPYGQVGDRLWAREPWCIGDGMNPQNDPNLPTFKADWPDVEHGRWVTPLFLKKKHARIWLEITGIRIERLQEISEEDCIKEGLSPKRHHQVHGVIPAFDNMIMHISARSQFPKLWDSINGKKFTWSSNPWVWVIEFRRIEVPK